MNLKAYFKILQLFLFFACANNETSNENKNKPLNIVYIMADDHAYQAISAYGS